MNWLPPMQVAVKKLALPGDIKARQREPRVIELAESIRERTGQQPIHPPVVEYPSMRLIAGRDRVAACLLNGARSIFVRPVSQLTDKERRDIERDENLHRRVDNRDELIRQRVLEREMEIEAQRAKEGEPVERAPGRPKTPKGEAREQVASELGTTPDAIRKAESRAAEEIAESDAEEIADIYPLSPVNTYGLPLTSAIEDEHLRAVQVAMEQVDGLLRRAQGVLSGVADLMPKLDLSILVHVIHAAAFDVRSAIPTAACPFCKRIPGLVDACKGCRTTGFIGSDGMLMTTVADELKLTGEAALVSSGGRLLPYAKVAAKAAPAPVTPDEDLAF